MGEKGAKVKQKLALRRYASTDDLIRVGCFQSNSSSPWCKRENDFATTWLRCQSLAGQVRPVRTQCTHATSLIRCWCTFPCINNNTA